jgi:hypothetical protein
MRSFNFQLNERSDLSTDNVDFPETDRDEVKLKYGLSSCRNVSRILGCEAKVCGSRKTMKTTRALRCVAVRGKGINSKRSDVLPIISRDRERMAILIRKVAPDPPQLVFTSSLTMSKQLQYKLVLLGMNYTFMSVVNAESREIGESAVGKSR